MLPFVVSCRLAQLSFVLILNIDYFLCLDYLSKDRFLGFGAKFFSARCRTKFFSAGCRAGSFGRPKNTKAAPFRAGVLLSFVLMSITWPYGQLFAFLGRQACRNAFYSFLSREKSNTKKVEIQKAAVRRMPSSSFSKGKQKVVYILKYFYFLGS